VAGQNNDGNDGSGKLDSDDRSIVDKAKANPKTTAAIVGGVAAAIAVGTAAVGAAKRSSDKSKGSSGGSSKSGNQNDKGSSGKR
jgi:hypothetical protein